MSKKKRKIYITIQSSHNTSYGQYRDSIDYKSYCRKPCVSTNHKDNMERKHMIPKTSSPKLTRFGPILNEITITENNIPMASDRIFLAEKL